MNKTIIFILGVFISATSLAQQKGPNQDDTTTQSAVLTVSTNGLDSDEGTLQIALYDNEGNWLNKRFAGQSTQITKGTAMVTFENIPFGTYAISTYHDENGNNKMDIGMFGIPSEPYMSSRGEKGRFGPPKWAKAKFEITTTNHDELIKY